MRQRLFVAGNMGTSVPVIEGHYGHLKPEMVPGCGLRAEVASRLRLKDHSAGYVCSSLPPAVRLLGTQCWREPVQTSIVGTRSSR